MNAYVEARAGTGDRDSFVTDLEESTDGVTVKLSTASLGRGIADRLTTQLGGTVGRSSTLVTEDEEGNPVYRVTYAVTLPPFQPGDVIDPDDDGGPVLVRSVRGNLKGTRLRTGEPYESPFDEGDAPDAELLGSVDDAVETTVVAVEDERAVQVLDPESYEAVTIARPPFVAADAATVSVLRHRGELHVVPDADQEWPPAEEAEAEATGAETGTEAEGGGRVDD